MKKVLTDEDICSKLYFVERVKQIAQCASVAQLDRAYGYGP